MFEIFTDRARRIVVLAQECARKLQHDSVRPEHIFLGILKEGQGVASKVMEKYELTFEDGYNAVIAVVGTGTYTTGGHLEFAPESKATLECALRESMRLGHNYIGTEHLLLGLLALQLELNKGPSSTYLARVLSQLMLPPLHELTPWARQRTISLLQGAKPPQIAPHKVPFPEVFGDGELNRVQVIGHIAAALRSSDVVLALRLVERSPESAPVAQLLIAQLVSQLAGPAPTLADYVLFARNFELAVELLGEIGELSTRHPSLPGAVDDLVTYCLAASRAADPTIS